MQIRQGEPNSHLVSLVVYASMGTSIFNNTRTLHFAAYCTLYINIP